MWKDYRGDIVEQKSKVSWGRGGDIQKKWRNLQQQNHRASKYLVQDKRVRGAMPLSRLPLLVSISGEPLPQGSLSFSCVERLAIGGGRSMRADGNDQSGGGCHAGAAQPKVFLTSERGAGQNRKLENREVENVDLVNCRYSGSCHNHRNRRIYQCLILAISVTM